MMKATGLTLLILSGALLAGCSSDDPYARVEDPKRQAMTRPSADNQLALIAPPERKIPIVVAEFQDLSRANARDDLDRRYSDAVAQNGKAALTKSLLDAGRQEWFMLASNGDARGKAGYSNLMIEGGVVSHQSRVRTGGPDAALLGLGDQTPYYEDKATVYVRAIDRASKEVMVTVQSATTVSYSSADSYVTRFVSHDGARPAEMGSSINEPSLISMSQALKSATYSLVMEGAIAGLWDFRDKDEKQRAANSYAVYRSGTAQTENIAALDPAQAANLSPAAGGKLMLPEARLSPSAGTMRGIGHEYDPSAQQLREMETRRLILENRYENLGAGSHIHSDY